MADQFHKDADDTSGANLNEMDLIALERRVSRIEVINFVMLVISAVVLLCVSGVMLFAAYSR